MRVLSNSYGKDKEHTDYLANIETSGKRNKNNLFTVNTKSTESSKYSDVKYLELPFAGLDNSNCLLYHMWEQYLDNWNIKLDNYIEVN